MTSSSMRLRLGAALLAGVLAVAISVAAPASAHGGGGGSRGGDHEGGRTQGRSHSNPDGGGVDKPYRAAGQEARTQGTSDWDGNNGCGNDDDRADDNNGWCGRHKDHEQAKVQSQTFTPAPSCQATCGDVKAAKLSRHDDEKVKALNFKADQVKVESADVERDQPEVKDVVFALDEELASCRRQRIAVNRVERDFCSCDHLAVSGDTLSAEAVKALEAKKAAVLAAMAAQNAAAAAPATKTVSAVAAATDTGAVLSAAATRAATPATGAELAAAGATTAVAPATAAAPATAGQPAQVLGVSLNRAAPAATGAAADTNTSVLGAVASRGVLAFTGFDTTVLVIMALALIAIGFIVRRYSAINNR
jgi:hypothetical protein